MKIKGIFFDIYGTLLIYSDTAWSEWFSIFYNCLNKYGLQIAKDSFAEVCEGFFGRPEPAAHDDDLTVYERRIKEFSIDLGLELKKWEIKNIARLSVNEFQKNVKLDPDALPVLETLRNNKILAIISNFDHPPHIRNIISNLNLNRLFDSIIISGEVGVRKPDPHIFSFALHETNLRSSEVVYVGDALEDIQGAQAANIHPILIQRTESSKNSLMIDYNLTQDFTNLEQSMKTKFTKIIKLTELVEMFP